MPRAKRKFVTCPFVIIRDTSEGAPYSFDGIKSDSGSGKLPLIIQTVDQHLPTGDYSIDGYEKEITIERKSRDDIFQTLGKSRERFEREFERMRSFAFAAVVVEDTLDGILFQPHSRSGSNPKTIYRTSVSWAMRYGVHWYFMNGRRAAECHTFRLLEMYYRKKKEGKIDA